MKMYEIYTSPIGGIEAVKKGWSWPAFFFAWIWAFVKGLYGLGAGVLIFGILFSIPSPALGLVYYLIVGLWLGSDGNARRSSNLISRGFHLADRIGSQTPEAAKALFVQNQKSLQKEQKTEDINAEAITTDTSSKLMNCPDCNKAVSRKAASCPNCGCPIAT